MNHCFSYLNFLSNLFPHNFNAPKFQSIWIRLNEWTKDNIAIMIKFNTINCGQFFFILIICGCCHSMLNWILWLICFKKIIPNFQTGLFYIALSKTNPYPTHTMKFKIKKALHEDFNDSYLTDLWRMVYHKFQSESNFYLARSLLNPLL